MKHSGFGIIELRKNNMPTEDHAMNNSITQDNQNDNQNDNQIQNKRMNRYSLIAIQLFGEFVNGI